MKIRLLAVAGLMVLTSVLSACGQTEGGETAGTPGAAGPQETQASGDANKRPVVVASKDFVEARLVGEMYAQVLENAGIPVERKLNLGATDIVHGALLKGGANGGVDLYPEYTSTGLLAVLEAEPIANPDEAYDAVKGGYEEKFPELTWLDRAPMNDTQAVVTTKENAERLELTTLQQLCNKAGELTIAARAEFKDRADALPRLQQLYGDCDFKEIKVVESGDLLYKALINGQVDVAQADSTAGEIAGNNLVLLEDPKEYGGPYNIAPVVREDVLEMYPDMAETLNNLSKEITTEEITQLNWEVAGKNREVDEVAKEWLMKEGLIK